MNGAGTMTAVCTGALLKSEFFNFIISSWLHQNTTDNQMQSASTAASNLRKLQWTESADCSWPIDNKKKKINLRHIHTVIDTHTFTEEKGRLIDTYRGEREADSGVGVQYRWNEREKIRGKNEPKIMGHCASTVHTIKHRPGAESLSNYSPINASGMIMVTAQDNYTRPSSEKKRRAGNWIPAVSVRRTWVRVEGWKKLWKKLNLSWDIIYLCNLRLTSI